MLIFAAESSAKTASVALTEDGRILGRFSVDTGLVHSKTLMPMAADLFRRCGRTPEEVDLFAAAVGPGSFTGVRIGVATVKGLALPHGKPCAAVSTLDAMAENLRHVPNILVCAVMDARREQVYNAMYETDSGGNLTRIGPERAVGAKELVEELKKAKKSVFYVGDGAELCYNISLESGVPAQIAPPHLRFQDAAGAAAAALRLWQRGQTVSAEALNPVYLRLPQAERERLERESGGPDGQAPKTKG